MEEDQLQSWQTQWMLSTNEDTQIVNNKGKYFQCPVDDLEACSCFSSWLAIN